MVTQTNLTLVAGARGVLGSRVVRRLLDRGMRVRAMTRQPALLREVAAAGGEVVQADLTDAKSLRTACEGATQVFCSANSVLGRGKASPRRVDARGIPALVDAAKAAGIERFVNMSAYGISASNPVDFFRIKHANDRYLRESGVPWVLLQPTAFMETWVNMLVTPIRDKGVATLFGSGTNPLNFVAVDDVADVAAAILADPKIRNEVIVVAGPQNRPQLELARDIGRALDRKTTIRHVPLAVLRFGPSIVGIVHEVAGRLLAMGYHTATFTEMYDDWQRTASRFGLRMTTLDEFIQQQVAAPSSQASEPLRAQSTYRQ